MSKSSRWDLQSYFMGSSTFHANLNWKMFCFTLHLIVKALSWYGQHVIIMVYLHLCVHHRSGILPWKKANNIIEAVQCWYTKRTWSMKDLSYIRHLVIFKKISLQSRKLFVDMFVDIFVICKILHGLIDHPLDSISFPLSTNILQHNNELA